ncbi:MAG: BMP family ABC transporter substrate-binding protein [Clostridiales bacterium]|nr:BMP family ABC transporter substrate-binding protein [Clostridiales bacterium]
MKKLLSVLLVFAIMAVGGAALAEGYELALVTDVGNIDDQSFNQSSYEGMVAFAEANALTYAYYRPSEDSDEARMESIRTAVDKGAKVVVLPGYLFAGSAAEAQAEFPEVNFIVIDTEPAGGNAPNTVSIYYQEEQSGFFAGYAAVKDGYTRLGFIGGMAVPAVIRFGQGFVQGADYAAQELGIDVDVKYWYCDSFGPSDDIKTRAAGWYTEGTEVIFACGGGIYLSIVAAAEEGNGKVIGVDTDQAHVSEIIITSAMKDLANSVQYALGKLYGNGGVWPEDIAGTTLNLGVADQGVGLPTAETSWRFNSFTVEEYEALYQKIVSGEIAVDAGIEAMPATVKATVDEQN